MKRLRGVLQRRGNVINRNPPSVLLVLPRGKDDVEAFDAQFKKLLTPMTASRS